MPTKSLQTLEATLKKNWGDEKVAEVLDQAEPYIDKLAGKKMVVKCSGSVLSNEKARENFVSDIKCLRSLDIKPIVVHGGGEQINKKLADKGVESKFHNGLRVTDAETMEVVKEVLFEINKKLSFEINDKKGEYKEKNKDEYSDKEIGNKRDNFLSIFKHFKVSRQSYMEKIFVIASLLDKDLGFVGKVESVKIDKFLEEFENQKIPVVPCLGENKNFYLKSFKHSYQQNQDSKSYQDFKKSIFKLFKSYKAEDKSKNFNEKRLSKKILNVNADTVASKIAQELSVERLHMLSNVDGIYKNFSATENTKESSNESGNKNADENKDKDSNAGTDSKIESTLTAKQAKEMIEAGEISGGMIPKVEACLSAFETQSSKGTGSKNAGLKDDKFKESNKEGLGAAHILNGMTPNNLLMELFTDEGIGTMIVNEGVTNEEIADEGLQAKN